MEICPNAEKDSTAIENAQCSIPLGPEGEGKEAQINDKKIEKEKFNDARELSEKVKECSETRKAAEKGKKESTLANLKKLVRGSSKVRTCQEEKHNQSLPENKEEKVAKDSKISKMFQNVSSTMSLRRVWGSSSATKVATDDKEKIDDPGTTGTGGGLGKMLFRRKSLSKTELESPDGSNIEEHRFRTLGNLFGRRSTSKADVMTPDSMNTEMKTLTLGRRLSSTFRGAFTKSDRLQQQVQEAP